MQGSEGAREHAREAQRACCTPPSLAHGASGHAAAQLFKLMQHGLARARSKRRTWLACVALALVAHSCGGTGCTELAVPWDFTPCVTWQRVDANCLVRNI